MNWKIRMKETIEEIVNVKRNLPDLRVNTEGDPDHGLLESEDRIMRIELMEEFKPIVYSFNEFKITNDKRIASIDSSSRYLRDFSVNFCLVGLSIYSNKKGFIDGPYSLDIPYMGISSYRKLLESLKLSDNNIRHKNILDYYYVNEPENQYKIDDIADELRTEAENVGLKNVIQDHDVVIIDGPIYPTPLELTEEFELETEARRKHKIAYAKLVKERIMTINGKVIGVVKRLENSKKLWRENEISEKLGGKLNGLKDVTILELIDEKFCRKNYQYICIIGPFKIEYALEVKDENDNKILDHVPPKYAYYVILRRPYFPLTFLRIESLERNFDFSSILSRITENLLPTYIEIVDKRSKRVSASLFIYAYEIASNNNLSVIHDDKITYSSIVTQFLLGSA
ncbi:DNA double-strand break repair nuclease NurA [Sulfolobus tengchongensis]|uniref:DNA double-strand break repair nuclease NurA n=1 Tax=Sulfolobus tengchongensis TaxID=207809 RepID=A0AAX4L1C6_9CREN